MTRRLRHSRTRVATAVRAATAVLAPALLLAVAAPVRAQSYNIDFGSGGSAPAAAFGAAGVAGAWNEVGVLPAFERRPLVDANGLSTGVQIYMFGGTAMLAFDDPATTGDDQALLDDMLIGFNDPVDVCVWLENLPNGDYEVLTYALTPDDPALACRVRVDFAAEGPLMVGGAFAGAYAEGLTHGRHTVTVTDGRIGLHSGLYGGEFQSGINGIQVRPVPVAPVDPIDGLRAGRLSVFPNPGFAAQSFRFDGASNRVAALQVLDVAGRLVWEARLPTADADRAAATLTWGGHDHRGVPVPPGIYLARVVTPAGGELAAPVRLVRVR